jgi:hypothetical protein
MRPKVYMKKKNWRSKCVTSQVKKKRRLHHSLGTKFPALSALPVCLAKLVTKGGQLF